MFASGEVGERSALLEAVLLLATPGEELFPNDLLDVPLLS